MNDWSNIEVPSQDSEIIEIDNFEKTLGELSKNIQMIRELIRRFEVCHFKYKEHLEYIKKSIQSLSPHIEPTKIGAKHISKGKDALKKDKTGRSILGQRYLSSLMYWLGDDLQEDSEYFNNELNQQIIKWLGNTGQNKEIMVRLLVSRLMWDWKSYEEYQNAGEYKELELQICRIDICHYTFPGHLDSLLQGIGRMKPVDNFDGCGTFNSVIETYIEEQYSILCDYLKSNINRSDLEQNERIKIWLSASLAKTLKEQIGIKEHLPQLN